LTRESEGMKSTADRKIVMVGFMQAQNSTTLPASWRYPSTMRDFLSPRYFQRIARTLEDGNFHMAFFDDRLAIPDSYNGNHRNTVRNGIRATKMDPIAPLMVMAAATERLGLGATYSTTYYQPYHVARLFASVDHMTNGRAAWNVVTSLNDSEAANFGFSEHLDHDARYDRAEEFIEVVTGHWRSWQPGAIKYDRDSGVFADPDMVTRLDHAGKYFSSRGPLSVPSTPQGHPVIIQAGQSGRGKHFASKWSDLIFTIFPDIEFAREQYKSYKQLVAEAGRDPSTVYVCPGVHVIVGETEAIAQEKQRVFEDRVKIEDKLEFMSELLNFDLGAKGIDDPFTDDELGSITGMRVFVDKVVSATGNANPTVRQFIDIAGAGTLRGLALITGNPKQVADQLEEWFTTGACDGFVLTANMVPGTYEDFVRLVVPELQRRGIFRTDYSGVTLRENLGLELPA
jgi:FMN-dependent oxidoreductase (nitrilotriacetate monooxygenase family)